MSVNSPGKRLEAIPYNVIYGLYYRMNIISIPNKHYDYYMFIEHYLPTDFPLF